MGLNLLQPLKGPVQLCESNTLKPIGNALMETVMKFSSFDRKLPNQLDVTFRHVSTFKCLERQFEQAQYLN